MVTQKIAHQFLKKLESVQTGHIVVHTPEGQTYSFGDPKSPIAADLKMHDWRCLVQWLARGDIGAGETYVSGQWDTSSLDKTCQFFLHNIEHLKAYADGSWLQRMSFKLLNTIIRRNSVRGSSKNIPKHYDLSNEFYALWLDPTLTYSSALFSDPHFTLEQAQRAKYTRIINKVGHTGPNVLEIGCGWGGFAEASLAHRFNYTGLTISPAQHEYAQNRIQKAGKVLLQDYRKAQGKYDSIVSIEMFEAVGERYWPAFFNTVKARLRNGGSAMIQTILIGDEEFDSYRKRSDFLRHYTFPGGMLPSLERFKQCAQNASLKVGEVYTFGKDYARTLRTWLENFDAALPQVHALGFSEPFTRSWRFYLSSCAAAFEVERINVAQVELSA